MTEQDKWSGGGEKIPDIRDSYVYPIQLCEEEVYTVS